MDLSVLETSSLFAGISAKELRDDLEATPHHIQCYDKGETTFIAQRTEKAGDAGNHHLCAASDSDYGYRVIAGSVG